MKRKGKQMLFGLCVTALIFGTSACRGFGTSKGDGTEVAMIYDQAVADYEFSLALEMQKDQALTQEGLQRDTPEADAFLNEEENGVKRIDSIKEEALSNGPIMQTKVLLSKAAEEDIVLSETDLADVEAQINMFIEQSGGEEAFIETILEPVKMNLEQYKLYMTNEKLADIYYEKAIADLEITDEEMNEQFEKEKENLEKVTVKHVLINNEGTEEKTRTKEESKALADEVLNKLNGGAEMDALVEEYSEDPGAVENHGEYTFTRNDSYVQSFKDWAFAAGEGDTGIVESDYGYHIMQFIGLEAAVLEEYETELKTYLQSVKYTEELSAAMEDEKYKPVINHAVYDTIN